MPFHAPCGSAITGVIAAAHGLNAFDLIFRFGDPTAQLSAMRPLRVLTFVGVLSTPAALLGQNLSLGLIGGGALTDAAQSQGASPQTIGWTPHKDWIAGAAVEFRAASRLSVEIDGMYRQLSAMVTQVDPTGRPSIAGISDPGEIRVRRRETAAVRGGRARITYHGQFEFQPVTCGCGRRHGRGDPLAWIQDSASTPLYALGARPWPGVLQIPAKPGRIAARREPNARIGPQAIRAALFLRGDRGLGIDRR